VQRVRQTEQLELEAEAAKICHPKKKADEPGTSADINMVFFLPAEYRNQPNEADEEEAVAHLVLHPQQARFDKAKGEKHWYLKALYLKGFVDRKPMTKMFVDGGVTVNLMPYTTYWKLRNTQKDLIKTDIMLKDFNGNSSQARGVLNVELTIGSKTLHTTFFIIDGKGSYNLLLGCDWIHTNCCIPSTMHRCLIQWQGDDVEIVSANTTVSITTANASAW
jgi:hypothetical protein